MLRMKSLSFTVIMTLVVLFSACAEAVSTPQPGTTLRIITATPRATTPPTATPTPIVPEMRPDQMAEVQIEFWYVAEPYLEDPLEPLVEAFIEENRYGMDVTVTRFQHPADLEAAVETAIEEGNLPDVILAYPYQYNAWVDAGVHLLDLNDYIDSSNYGLSAAAQQEIYAVLWERDIYGGVRRGFPGLFYGQVLLYNRTWAQELGFADPPLSAEQFSRQACAAAEAAGDGTGGWMIETQPGSAAAWLLSFTGDLESGSGYQFDLPEVTAALTFLAGLRAEGCAWRPSSSFAYDSFANRKGLFYSISTRELGAAQAAFEEAGFLDTWDVIGLPNDRGEPAIGVYGRSYVILESGLPQQVGAWMLVAALTSLESQVALAEAAGYYPLSTAAGLEIRDAGVLPRAWVNGLALLENAAYEPRWPSWRVVRGVVQDATAEVLREGFAVGTISVVIDQFQELVSELHDGD